MIITHFKAFSSQLAALLKCLPYGLAAALPALAGTCLGSLWPYRYADGAVVRPMFEGLFLSIFVFMAFLVGVPLSLWDIRRSWKAHRKLGIVLGAAGLLLNLMPWPLGLTLTDYFVAQQHLTLEQ